MMPLKKLLRPAFWPAWISLLGVTVLSTLPTMPMPGSFNLFSIDKLGHALAYALITWLLLRAFRRSSVALSGKVIAAVTLFSILYGILMEYIQYRFVPGRFYEIDDMLANAAGAVIAAGLWRVMSYEL